MSNVIEFNRPTQSKQVETPKPAPKLSEAKERNEWKAALAAVWASPKNWRTSKHGNRYIVIDDLGICVVIGRDESGGGFQWEIRWRCRNKSTVSRWVFISEQVAIDEAWDAVVALA